MTFTPDQELAVEQVIAGECADMTPKLAEHVHRVAAHALAERCVTTLIELRRAEQERDAARATLEAFLGQVRSVTLDVLDEEYRAHG